MNWNGLHLFFKIGYMLNILSVLVLLTKLAIDGPFIMSLIQLSIFTVGVIMITMGIIKMRQANKRQS